MSRVISAVLTLKDKDFSTNAKKASSALTDTQREAKHAQNTVSGFAKSATSSFGSIARGAASIVGAIGVTKALSSAFNTVRNSVGDAMDRIDTMEQFERVMGVMVDDTDKVTATMDRLNDMLEGTSMRTDVMSKGIQNFVTRGIEIETATDYMEAFGNAVSFYGDGSSESFDSVTDALQNMIATGKVDMQQMNRITASGIPAMEIYADAVGTNTDEVSQMLSSGAVDAEEFVSVVSEAMMEGTDKFPEISTAMQDAGSSWKSVMDNIGAFASQGMTKVVTAIDDALENNGLPDMRGMLTNFGETLGEVIGSAADYVPTLTGYLVGMYEKSKPGIDWMKDTGFPAIQDAVGFALDKATDLYSFFKDNWSAIGPVIAGVAATITAFKVGVIVITTAMRIWTGVTTAMTIAQAIFNGTLAVSPLGWVALAIGAVVAVGIALWKNWDTLKDGASSLWDTVKSAFGTMKDSVVGWFGNMRDKVVELWDRLGGFKGAVLALMGPIGALIAIGINLYKNWDVIKERAVDMTSNVKTRILDMKDKVVGWFGDLKDGAVEKFNDIVTSAKELPGKIGQGIADYASKALDGIKELGKKLKESFMKALNMGSPSKDFHQMGEWIVEGLVNGLNAGNLLDLGKSVFKGFAGGALDTLASIKDFFTGGGSVGTTTLDTIVKQIQSKFKGLVVTSTFRPGDPNDHGKGLAVDLSGYGSSGGYKAVAQYASRLPGVTYTIGDNTVYGNKYGDGSMPSWAKGHMNHVHVSFKKGYKDGGRVTSSGNYLVGESGPEIVSMPAGSRVHNNQDSSRMKGNSPNIIININGVDKSINEIINELVPMLKLRLANM